MTPTPRRLTSALVALGAFGGGLGLAAGLHAQQVDQAHAQALETAKSFDETLATLDRSFRRAEQAATDAADVADDGEVASAATRLRTVAAEVDLTARAHSLALELPDVALPTEGDDETAAGDDDAVASTASDGGAGAGATGNDATGNEDAASTAAELAAPVPAIEDVLDDPEVIDVLEGRVTDLETVEATIARLEEATAALDTQARRIEGSVAQLEEASALALLETASQDFDGVLEALTEEADAAADTIAAVTDRVADPETLTDLDAARQDLVDLIAEEHDRTSTDTIDDAAAGLEDAAVAVAEAGVAVQASHTTWVENENARREAENAERTETHRQALKDARAARTAAYRQAAASHQAGWSGRPTGVSGSNGHVASSQLCGLSFASGHVLHCDAANALELADKAYHQETGSHLQLISSYRSYSAQVRTRATRGAYAATPGTSNHGWGMAVDLDASSAAWLRAHGADYGWVHPTWARSGGSKPESWHLEYVAPGVGDLDVSAEPDLLDPVRNLLAD